MDEFVAALRSRELLTADAARRVAELEDRAHLPLAKELHAFLYLGAALLLAGVGAAVKDRLDQLGPATILAALGLSAAACYAYCFRLVRPFAPERVEAPTAAFDYALYLACGLTGIFFTYLEWRWKPLGAWWDLYLLGSGLLFWALAYRFDNRLVLTTALVNLALWLGARASLWAPGELGPRLALTAYGVALFALGCAARRGALKPHFADAYLRLGVYLALSCMLVDAMRFDAPQFVPLLAACAALSAWSLRERRFDTFAAAVGFAYVSVLASLLRGLDGDAALWTVVLSAAGVLAALLWARSRFREAVS